MNILSWFPWKFSCMLQCCSFSFTFAMKQFTFIKLQFLFWICRKNLIHRACSVAMYLSDREESACNAGDPGPIPWSGRSPGRGTGTHSSILAWRIPWTEEPGKLQSMVHKESDKTEQLTFLLFWFLNFSCERHRNHYCGILPKILSYNTNILQLEL